MNQLNSKYLFLVDVRIFFSKKNKKEEEEGISC